MRRPTIPFASLFFRGAGRLIAVAAVFVLLLPLAVRPAAAQTGEEIRSFVSNVDVQMDGRINVTERGLSPPRRSRAPEPTRASDSSRSGPTRSAKSSTEA